MFDNFGYNDGMAYDESYDNDYDNTYKNYNGYKPLKATTRNVQDTIACLLGVDTYMLDFEKVDEPPNINDWKHSCFQSGVIKMNVNQFLYEDGSNIIYATCPYCNKVHYYIDKAQF